MSGIMTIEKEVDSTCPYSLHIVESLSYDVIRDIVCIYVKMRELFMKINTEKDIITIIQQDKWMMKLLNAVSSLNLPDWWICAGFVRAKIWDELHDFDERTPTPDIDVIYYDSSTIDEKVEKKYEKALEELLTNYPLVS